MAHLSPRRTAGVVFVVVIEFVQTGGARSGDRSALGLGIAGWTTRASHVRAHGKYVSRVSSSARAVRGGVRLWPARAEGSWSAQVTPIRSRGAAADSALKIGAAAR
jgi:hypothetical protein